LRQAAEDVSSDQADREARARKAITQPEPVGAGAPTPAD